jgi:anti-anti-sigma factor
VSTSREFTGSLHLERQLASLTISGEVDVFTISRFRGLLDAAIALKPTHVTVDLDGVTYLGACAVPVFEEGAARLARSGGRLELLRVPRLAHRLLQVAGLSDRIDVERADSESAVIRRLAEGGIPRARQVLDVALQLVVTMAQAVVAGAHGVSITLPRHGQLGTVAASNDVVLEMDHDQYETGQGPCLDAALQGTRFQIDVLDEESRWPEFVPRARARGIASILSTPLVASGRPLGALNIYSRDRGAFAAHEKQWADQFAAESASVVLVAGGAGSSASEGDLADALASRHAIALAQGVLIGRHGGTPEAAYSALTNVSRRTGRPLRRVCDDLVTSRTTQGAMPLPTGPHA